jgi:hypothetical protein
MELELRRRPDRSGSRAEQLRCSQYGATGGLFKDNISQVVFQIIKDHEKGLCVQLAAHTQQPGKLMFTRNAKGIWGLPNAAFNAKKGRPLLAFLPAANHEPGLSEEAALARAKAHPQGESAPECLLLTDGTMFVSDRTHAHLVEAPTPGSGESANCIFAMHAGQPYLLQTQRINCGERVRMRYLGTAAIKKKRQLPSPPTPPPSLKRACRGPGRPKKQTWQRLADGRFAPKEHTLLNKREHTV